MFRTSLSSFVNSASRYAYSSVRRPSITKKKAPITLTHNAMDRIRYLLNKNKSATGILFGVTRRGCNGYSYRINYLHDKDMNHHDIHSQNDITYAVENKALFSIVGSIVDFEDTPLSSEFIFKNPTSKGECGCGESFNM